MGMAVATVEAYGMMAGDRCPHGLRHYFHLPATFFISLAVISPVLGRIPNWLLQNSLYLIKLIYILKSFIFKPFSFGHGPNGSPHPFVRWLMASRPRPISCCCGWPFSSLKKYSLNLLIFWNNLRKKNTG
jgi:hypothetical protein